MYPNHAEICRVGNLEPDFQKFHLFNFSEIFPILLWNINHANSAKKSKKYIFSDKHSKKSHYFRNYIGQANFSQKPDKSEHNKIKKLHVLRKYSDQPRTCIIWNKYFLFALWINKDPNPSRHTTLKQHWFNVDVLLFLSILMSLGGYQIQSYFSLSFSEFILIKRNKTLGGIASRPILVSINLWHHIPWDIWWVVTRHDIKRRRAAAGIGLSKLIRAITKTCLYNTDPLKPHFYIVKLGFTWVYNIFLISAQKQRLWVLVRTASLRRF